MTAALRAEGVDCGYGDVTILRGVDLEVPAGRIVGLHGPSGTGKTTLARTLAGLLPPLGGRVTVDGQQLVAPGAAARGAMMRRRRTPGTAARAVSGLGSGRIGMLFQSPRRSCDPRSSLAAVIGEPLYVGSAATRAARMAGRPGRGGAQEAIEEVAAQVGLTPDLLHRLPAQVSDGQLQRACLARALLQRPAYLICDEATAMLDAVSTAVLADLIRRRAQAGLGVLAISHDTALLRAWADDVRELSTATHA